MAFLFGGGGGFRRTFEHRFNVLSVGAAGRPELENGGKIILPASALHLLAQLNIEYPMLFEISHTPESGGGVRLTHAGVLDFTAEEGRVYLPYWMMQHLLVGESGIVTIKSATLPLGNYVKLQPHSSDFIDISNPKAVLENVFRNFAALTTGDVIVINYNERQYYISIVEVKPDNAISIIETDVQVDFAEPLDYKEKMAERERKKQLEAEREARLAAAAGRSGASGGGDGGGGGDAASGDEGESEPKFIPFVGSGRRMDGKTVSPLSTSPSVRASSARPIGGGSSSSSSAAPVARSPALTSSGNALVFGTTPGAEGPSFGGRSTSSNADEPSGEPDKSSFKAFAGEGRRLG